MRSLLSRLFPIYPGEGAPFALCFAVNLLTLAGIMFGRAARDSLFFVFFGVEYLPYMYFGVPYHFLGHLYGAGRQSGSRPLSGRAFSGLRRFAPD